MTYPISNNTLGKLRIRQLYLLISIGQHKSLVKASKELSITLSAASKSLQEIEQILGGVLFERMRDGLHPNELGQCAISYAQIIRKDIKSMCDELSTIQTGQTGRIRLGAIMGSIPLVTDTINSLLNNNLLHFKIEFLEGTSAQLLTMLENDQLDIAIGRTSVSMSPDNFNYIHLLDEQTSVVIGFNHPLTKQKNISLNELKNFNWISFPTQMPLSILLRQELERAGLNEAQLPIETASTVLTSLLLKKNQNLLAFLPTSVAQQLEQQKLINILPVQLPQRAQPFGLITYKKRNLPGNAMIVIEALTTHFSLSSSKPNVKLEDLNV